MRVNAILGVTRTRDSREFGDFSIRLKTLNGKNGVLRKLKHIFPNTYQRINSICSPAKVGLVVTDFNYQPGS